MQIDTRKYDCGTYHVDIKVTDEEMKPCPFCGSHDIEVHHTWTHSYRAKCKDCGAKARCNKYVEGITEEDMKNLDVYLDAHKVGFNGAVEAWNTRAPLPAIKVKSPEDIGTLDEEILCWDGCEWHIDFVTHCPENGINYMVNGTDVEAYLLLTGGPKVQG